MSENYSIVPTGVELTVEDDGGSFRVHGEESVEIPLDENVLSLGISVMTL